MSSGNGNRNFMKLKYPRNGDWIQILMIKYAISLIK